MAKCWWLAPCILGGAPVDDRCRAGSYVSPRKSDRRPAGRGRGMIHLAQVYRETGGYMAQNPDYG